MDFLQNTNTSFRNLDNNKFWGLIAAIFIILFIVAKSINQSFAAILTVAFFIYFNYKSDDSNTMLNTNPFKRNYNVDNLFLNSVRWSNLLVVILLLFYLFGFGEHENEKDNEDDKSMFKSTNYWAWLISVLILLFTIGMYFYFYWSKRNVYINLSGINYNITDRNIYFGINILFLLIQVLFIYWGRDWEFGY